MLSSTVRQRDPILWSALLTLAFLAFCLFRLTIPSKPYFDEVHYLPAARALLDLSRPLNVEHPLLGKELIAAGIALFGDNPLGWRIMSAGFGALALFAFLRALWHASQRRVATLAGGALLATGGLLLVHARIAMLDIFMVAFALLALWALAAAMRTETRIRLRLAIAGIALGLAMASKYNAIPLAVLPGLALLVLRVLGAGGAFLNARDVRPLPGITLVEAGFWLGILPLLAYALTFLPAFYYAESPLTPGEFIAYHQQILHLQSSVTEQHTYQSGWTAWVTNIRPIWYLYEVVDGAQRGVLLLGNPLTMLLGLAALLWCGWAGAARQRWDALAVVVLYLATLALWWFADKPVQFYYHYLLPSCFLFAALGLAIDRLWEAGKKRVVWAVLGGTLALFAWFYPIYTAMPLSGPQSFLTWAWFESWR